jgi:hypothetical protein
MENKIVVYLPNMQNIKIPHTIANFLNWLKHFFIKMSILHTKDVLKLDDK